MGLTFLPSASSSARHCLPRLGVSTYKTLLCFYNDYVFVYKVLTSCLGHHPLQLINVQMAGWGPAERGLDLKENCSMKDNLKEITTIPESLSAAPCICISSAPVPLSSCEKRNMESLWKPTVSPRQTLRSKATYG